MDRIAAELTDSAPERAKLLVDSVSRLRAAIDLFSGSAEFGPTHRQVGDSYSLLGRTHLVAKDFSAAMDDLRKAYDILPEGTSKEFMDLLILSGDLEIARGNREDGERYYDRVIDWQGNHGREASEIRARAFMQRGRSRQRRNSRDAAKQDLERAASMWKALDEHALAAEAEWALMKLNPSVDEKTISMFDDPKSRLVAVTALRQYLDRLGTTKVHARRAQPTRSQVDQMVKEARRRVAEAHREW